MLFKDENTNQDNGLIAFSFKVNTVTLLNIRHLLQA